MDQSSDAPRASTVSWQTVEVYPNRGFAEVAGSALASAGMPFRVIADDAGAMGLPLSLRHSGAELQVPAEDLDDAREILQVTVPVDTASGDELDDARLVMQAGPLLRWVVGILVAALVIAVVASLLP